MLSGYESMIKNFVAGELSARQFEATFLQYFKSDTHQVSSDEFDILDELFADVDEYVEDPQLRATTGGIDESELRDRAKKAYRLLYSNK